MKNLLTVLSIWVYITISQAQNTFFVSTYGDNNSNGTIDTPWKTIQYAMDQLSPGDILNIREGRYFEKLQMNTLGSKDQHIIIQAYKNENVIVDGDSFNDNRALFFAYEKNYFTVRGIHFTNCYHLSGGGGFTVYSTGQGIRLIDCTFSNIAISRDTNKMPNYNTNQPVVTFIGTHPYIPIKDIVVHGIEIYNCRPGYSECLSISGNAEEFEFSNNYIHNNANIGIDAIGNYGYCPTKALDQARHGLIKNNICHDNRSPVAASAGIYIDGGRNIIIENNVLYNNHYGAEIGCEESGTASHIIFRNNVVFNNYKAGIALGGYSTITKGKVTDSKIVNNTFYNNDINNNTIGELFISQLEHSIISNNIFYLSDQSHLMSNYREQHDVEMTYNLIYAEDGEDTISSYWDTQTLYGVQHLENTPNTERTNFYLDPKFNDSNTLDFSLRSDSGAIDRGDPNYTPDDGERDMNNDSRLFNGIVDCGADEVHNLNTEIHTKEASLSVYPNPAINSVFVKGLPNQQHTISFIDTSGKLVAEHQHTEEKQAININNLPSGMYIVNIKDSTQEAIKKHKIIKY